MFKELLAINTKPLPFEVYTADELWTNEFAAARMLELHLDDSVDAASRNRAFVERSGEWIIRHFELGAGKTVIDFGCGPGLYTSKLAESGAKVTGLDFSRNSLYYAKDQANRNGHKIEYICTNYLDFERDEKYDLITLIFCDYTALSPSQRSRLLKKFRAMLKAGGSILLDAYSLNHFNSKQESMSYDYCQNNKFWSAEDYFCFYNLYKYEQERLLLDKYVICTQKNDVRHIYNWFQCYSVDSIRSEFEAHGFVIKELYANVAGDVYDPAANEFAVVVQLG